MVIDIASEAEKLIAVDVTVEELLNVGAPGNLGYTWMSEAKYDNRRMVEGELPQELWAVDDR